MAQFAPAKTVDVFAIKFVIFELEQRDKEAVLLKEKNAEIEEANRKLQLSNKELAQYAHVASHDLKEPLRMVSVYVDLLKNRMNEKLSEEELKFMEYAIDGSKRMQHLIHDLLELSKNKCSLKNTNG